MIIDASLSGEALVALLRFRNGDRRLVRLGARGVSEQPLCARPPIEVRLARRGPPYALSSPETGPAVRIRAFALDRSGRETMASGRPVVMLHRVAGAGRRDAVVYAHGGPGGTLADDEYFLQQIMQLATPRRDLVMVEYSGSQGGGIALTRRLADRGMAALEEDVSALARWLERQGYRRVSIIGSSFGAAPTLAAVTRHRRLFSTSFLVAPALRLLDPGQWVDVGGGLAPIAPDTQMAYERAYHGGAEGRRAWAAALDRLVANAPLGRSDHFYFGGHDPISQPSHLPARIDSPRHVAPREIHASLLANASVWRDILAHLD